MSAGLDIRTMEVFVEVARHLHFGAAARALHLPPSVVSDSVKRLEHHLGVVLMDRSSRRVQLTRAGQSFLGDAEAILARLRAAQVRAQEWAQGARGTLRFAVTMPPAPPVACRIIQRAAQLLPGIRILPSSHATLDQGRLLDEGEVDVALGFEPPVTAAHGCCPVTSAALVVYLRDDDALTGRDPVPLTALADDGRPLAFVARSVHPWTHDAIARSLRVAGIDTSSTLDIFDELSLFDAVHTLGARGLGPAHSTARAPQGVDARTTYPLLPALGFSLWWRLDADNPAVAPFVELVTDMASSRGFEGLVPTPVPH